MVQIQVQEQRAFALEEQLDRADRAVTVLGHDDFGNVLAVTFRVVIALAVQEGHDIRILFQGP